MTNMLNETHNTELTSWVKSANETNCDFPIQNLPFAIMRRAGSQETFRAGVAIGDQVLDLAAVKNCKCFKGLAQSALASCDLPELNAYMAMGKQAWSALRLALSKGLRTGSKDQAKLADCLINLDAIEYQLPCRIGDYTDFYTSIYHATAVGQLFRPDNPLLPNYKWLPIGYHGRSSSINVSGDQIKRPCAQLKTPETSEPIFSPCKKLDYEMEVGIYIGSGNQQGDPISLNDAENHVFGMCLFNDWSARDIQAWEYQPLGPFLAKNFASTVSPWIITTEALAPFKVNWSREPSDPQPLNYLESEQNRQSGAFDIQLEVQLQTEKMRTAKQPSNRLSLSSFRHSYWTVAQMVAHHTVNGCNLMPGDMFGSGTQSGPHPDEAGSLIELSQGGKQSIQLDNGETRTFLEDGDCVIMRGWCQKKGATRIGFGEVVSTVLPSEYETDTRPT